MNPSNSERRELGIFCYRVLKLQGFNSSILNNLILNYKEKEESSKRQRFKIAYYHRGDFVLIRSVILFSPEAVPLRKITFRNAEKTDEFYMTFHQ